jgi:hypothetical protein
MKEEIILQEKIKLLEKEIATLSDMVSAHKEMSDDIEGLKLEIRSLKLFLSRHFPEFKDEYLRIMEKVESPGQAE